MYELAAIEDELSQGDILDGCPVGILDANSPPATGASTFLEFRARVIVLTQSCDLAQLKSGKVIVAIVRSCDEVVRLGLLKASAIRDQVRTHRMPGWYFLPTAPGPIPLPESIVEMRELHTLPRRVLDDLISANRRVCRVVTPYREHLSQHFAITYMRIGLPEPYATEA